MPSDARADRNANGETAAFARSLARIPHGPGAVHNPKGECEIGIVSHEERIE